MIQEQRRCRMPLPTFSDNPDAWDSYYTLVDDCPAAITLDFAVGEHAPLPEHGNFLAILLYMNEPGEHGMGDGTDPEALRHVEQQIVHAFEATLGALFVGRVRSQGVWQLYFYTIANESAGKQATELLSGFSGWEQEIHSRADPEWELYFGLLFPDSERLQWIRNRKFCEALAEEGDLLKIPRRVDHYAYFSTSTDRKHFAESIVVDEFEIEELSFDPTQDLAFKVQFHRSESVELESIHQVVMQLVARATDNDGIYDDWETSILSPHPVSNLLPN